MTAEKPPTCTLDGDRLARRLAWIAEIGAESLVAREEDGSGHRLRFRDRPSARRRLEGLIAAESECCSSLSLSLAEADGELILSIASPEEARALAAALADSF
jgi:hypothetical protein